MPPVWIYAPQGEPTPYQGTSYARFSERVKGGKNPFRRARSAIGSEDLHVAETRELSDSDDAEMAEEAKAEEARLQETPAQLGRH